MVNHKNALYHGMRQSALNPEVSDSAGAVIKRYHCLITSDSLRVTVSKYR